MQRVFITAFGEELRVHGAESFLFNQAGGALGFEIPVEALDFCPREVRGGHQMIQAFGPPVHRIVHVVELGI